MKRSVFVKALCALSILVALVLPAGCAEKETDEYTVIMDEAETVEPLSVVDMLAKIRPSVVDVTTYFDNGAGAGSGVIIAGEINDDGIYEKYYIVTNHHVIDGGNDFVVDVLTIDPDGEEYTTAYEARLVGSSLKRDIAVLSIRPQNGVQLVMASFIDNSDNVKVGTEVFAIGNPLGILGGTVTHGIVSATKRDVTVGDIGTMTLMQTDTSINGGNSGGGLFDSNGNVVGIINSGYDTYNGQNVEGLNFAIPANDAKFAAKSLIETHVETNGEVTGYGYVEGDARLDVEFGTAALYTDETISARKTYLVGQATGSDSPFYTAWGEGAKAILSIEVNGVKTDFSDIGSSSYSLTSRANAAISNVRAGDTIIIEYSDVSTRSYGGFFGVSYNFLSGGTKRAEVVAEQYIYQP